jgi:hypothetical protein
MNRLKLLSLAAILSLCLFSSCEKDDETNLIPDTSRYISNYDFFLTGTQQIPSNTSTGNGRIEGTYDRRTKVYSYKITWSGLSSAVTGIHIHGLAGRGYVAIPGTYANGIASAASGNSTATSGSYSGTLLIDGIVIRESDFLAGKYYADIHTSNFPLGEIRGQILFP